MFLKTNAIVLIAATALAAGAAAQTSTDSASAPAAAGPTLSPKAGMITMHLDNMDAAPVKGAPFCANVATEHTQAFADGNRIHTIDNSTLCRDSEGRTRREAGLNLLGAGAQTTASRLITIADPVSGVRYILDPDNKIAHKMSLPFPDKAAAKTAGPAGLPEKGEHTVIFQSAGSSAPSATSNDVFFFRKVGNDSDEAASATENLGDQTIHGIEAAGTRMTTTIPSGKMGNDKPITVTSERWYSSDLKATVMTKHIDPWAGELKTEFSSVNTSEPDPSLFRVPSDYQIVDDKSGAFNYKMFAPVPAGH